MGQLETTWSHIRRSPYQSIAAVMIMVLTFLVASIFILLGIGGGRIVKYFESMPQITAFFREEASQNQIADLEKSLKETGKVSSIRFVSKEEALKIYQEQNKNDPLLTELVTADILPASLEVSAVKVQDLDGLARTLKSSEIISEIVFPKEIVDTLVSWTDFLRKMGLVLFLSLSLVSIFIIITVVGMKISLRRDEIEITRLIGASAWYIRWPFILEGALYGAVGSFMAWVLSYLLLLWASTFLKSFLSGIPILPISPFLMLGILGVELTAAVILGALGSFLAVLRYLK